MEIFDSVWRGMSTDERFAAAMILLDSPVEQMLRVIDLIGELSARNVAIGYIGRCENGCCINVQEKGMDETCWSVNRQLQIQKYDGYNNVLEELDI